MSKISKKVSLLPIVMSARGFAAFMRTLNVPPRLVPELIDVSKRRAPWESNDKSSEA